MALTFPIDLRTSGLRLQRVTFSLARSVATAKLPTGAQVMETGVAIWRASITLRPEREHGRRRAAAFIDALSGTGTFLCFSPAQCWPAAHPGGVLTGWHDTLVVAATTATTITATGAASGLRLRAGDLVGIERLGKYGLFRVLADAAPAAGTITLQVAPRVPSFLAGGTLRLKQPVCEMVRDPSSEADMGDGLSMSPVSFQAIQKVS